MKTLCTNCVGGLVPRTLEIKQRNQGKPVVCYECQTHLSRAEPCQPIQEPQKQDARLLTR